MLTDLTLIEFVSVWTTLYLAAKPGLAVNNLRPFFVSNLRSPVANNYAGVNVSESRIHVPLTNSLARGEK